jgi:hypothetical protein
LEEDKFVFKQRFASEESIDGIPLILETIATHYFGNQTNLVTFTDVKLPNHGTIDFVLARHKSCRAEIDDFLPVEFRTIPPADTANERRDVFVRRFLSQILARGIVYEAWGMKSYWVIPESVYANLVERYGWKPDEFSAEHALRFALQDISAGTEGVKVTPTCYVSASMDEIYHALRNDSGLPSKSQFIAALNARLERTLLSGVRKKVS